MQINYFVWAPQLLYQFCGIYYVYLCLANGFQFIIPDRHQCIYSHFLYVAATFLNFSISTSKDWSKNFSLSQSISEKWEKFWNCLCQEWGVSKIVSLSETICSISMISRHWRAYFYWERRFQILSIVIYFVELKAPIRSSESHTSTCTDINWIFPTTPQVQH